MITFLNALILGIVEGITEFLPISSTVHLDLTSRLLGIVQNDVTKSFLIVIQLGAIIGVTILFAKDFLKSFTLIKKTIISFLPVAIIGFLVYPLVKQVLLGNILIEICTLFIGGITFVIFSKKFNVSLEKNELSNQSGELSTKNFFILGLWQCLALIPGMSRSGSILIGGLVHDLNISQVVRTAFLIALPTMAAASGYDLLKTGISFTNHDWFVLLFGMIVSGIVAYFVAQFFMRLMKRKNALAWFGWYRIVLAIILLVLFFQS